MLLPRSLLQKPLLVLPIGDALQEPFWPEGLGINRGFLGAYDCAELVMRSLPLLRTNVCLLVFPLLCFASCCLLVRC